MRIIAGRLGGRILKTVEGEGYRPAMGRTREALFSMLVARGLVWSTARVLDLFAGSGSLALESISRGAPHALLVENSTAAMRCLQANVESLGVQIEAGLVKDDVLKVLRAHHRAIDFLNKHPDEANRILAEAFEIAPVKTADGREIAPVKVIEEARKRIGWSDRIENTDLQFIQRLINYSRSLGFLNKDLKATEFIDTSWQQRAVQAPAKPAAVRQN